MLFLERRPLTMKIPPVPSKTTAANKASWAAMGTESSPTPGSPGAVGCSAAGTGVGGTGVGSGVGAGVGSVVGSVMGVGTT